MVQDAADGGDGAADRVPWSHASQELETLVDKWGVDRAIFGVRGHIVEEEEEAVFEVEAVEAEFLGDGLSLEWGEGKGREGLGWAGEWVTRRRGSSAAISQMYLMIVLAAFRQLTQALLSHGGSSGAG